MSGNQSIQKLISGCYYHIYNRGNNKEVIFREPDNYIYFLALWKKYIEPVAETFCYNLLPNHFHFFVRVKEDPYHGNESQTIISSEQNFSNLFNAYAKAINKKYDRTGSLFQERFRRKQIDSDSYFTSLTGYIISNSVKHGLSESSVSYPYSAYHALISDKATSLLRDELFDWFGGRENFIRYIDQYENSIYDKNILLERETDDDS